MINIDGTIDGLKRIFSNYELDLPFTDSSDIESEIIVLLEELKELKKSAPNRRFYTLGYKEGYKKAIDDFASKLRTKCDGMIKEEWNSNVAPISWAEAYADFKDDIDEIAEQLKAGDKE